MEEQNNTENNLISLLKEFIRELRLLISEHINLFKRDLSVNTHRVIKAVVSILMALVLGYAGLLFLGLLAVYLLAMLIPVWTALLLVTAIYFGIPLILLVYSINLFHRVFKEPKKSVEEMEKTGEEAQTWLKNIKK